MNGRKKDVLIEDYMSTDPRTGVEVKSDWQFKVWADAGLKELIQSVEGVVSVFCTLRETEYTVYIDKRYDMEFIKREVESAILCK